MDKRNRGFRKNKGGSTPDTFSFIKTYPVGVNAYNTAVLNFYFISFIFSAKNK